MCELILGQAQDRSEDKQCSRVRLDDRSEVLNADVSEAVGVAGRRAVHVLEVFVLVERCLVDVREVRRKARDYAARATAA